MALNVLLLTTIEVPLVTLMPAAVLEPVLVLMVANELPVIVAVLAEPVVEPTPKAVLPVDTKLLRAVLLSVKLVWLL